MKLTHDEINTIIPILKDTVNSLKRFSKQTVADANKIIGFLSDFDMDLSSFLSKTTMSDVTIDELALSGGSDRITAPVGRFFKKLDSLSYVLDRVLSYDWSPALISEYDNIVREMDQAIFDLGALGYRKYARKSYRSPSQKKTIKAGSPLADSLVNIMLNRMKAGVTTNGRWYDRRVTMLPNGSTRGASLSFEKSELIKPLYAGNYITVGFQAFSVENKEQSYMTCGYLFSFDSFWISSTIGQEVIRALKANLNKWFKISAVRVGNGFEVKFVPQPALSASAAENFPVTNNNVDQIAVTRFADKLTRDYSKIIQDFEASCIEVAELQQIMTETY